VLWNTNVERAVIHIDTVPAELDNHYQPVLELRGGVAATLDELTPLLSDLPLCDAYAFELAHQRQVLTDIDEDAHTASAHAHGVNPAALLLALRDGLDDDATVACDIGSVYIYMARHFRAYQPRHLLFSDGQQTLGVGLPWAMAAPWCAPAPKWYPCPAMADSCSPHKNWRPPPDWC
jgi:acetolactate synthase-1/2/3 large subunit